MKTNNLSQTNYSNSTESCNRYHNHLTDVTNKLHHTDITNSCHQTSCDFGQKIRPRVKQNCCGLRTVICAVFDLSSAAGFGQQIRSRFKRNRCCPRKLTSTTADVKITWLESMKIRQSSKVRQSAIELLTGQQYSNATSRDFMFGQQSKFYVSKVLILYRRKNKGSQQIIINKQLYMYTKCL